MNHQNSDHFKIDGWSNILTGLGLKNKDKRLRARVETGFLDQQTLEALYQSDDIAAKVIDRLPEDMMREGFEIKIEGDSEKLGEKILLEFEKFNAEAKIEKALKFARLYGGSGILIGIKGDNPELPLDLNSLSEIEYLTVLDRYRLQPAGILQEDITQPHFGMPEYYQLSVSVSGKAFPKIHHSRILRFDGIKLPYSLMAKNQYWGDSVLSRLYNPLLNFNTGYDSAAAIIQDFTQAVFKMKNLAELIAQGDEKLVQARLELVNLKMSILNAIVIQDDEEFERKTTNVSGIADLIKIVKERLMAGTEMPHTILFGESPSGLGATGESEKIDWYDHVKNKQESILRPVLKRLIDLVCSAKRGPTNGKIPENYTIEFKPLWQMDQKEKAEIRKVVAETDALYLDRGVLDPDEIASSRFGSEEYSMETKIDVKARNAFEKGEQPSSDFLKIEQETLNV